MPVPRRSLRGRVKASVVLRALVWPLPAPPGLRHLGDGAGFRDGTFGGEVLVPPRAHSPQWPWRLLIPSQSRGLGARVWLRPCPSLPWLPCSLWGPQPVAGLPR